MWLSKDKNGKVHLSLDKPKRRLFSNSWTVANVTSSFILIPKAEWSKYGCESLRWEDEPIEVRIERI